MRISWKGQYQLRLIDENNIRYDTKRYLELLKETYDSVTKFFYSQIPKYD